MESLISSFVLGIGAAASPCLLPLYPTLLAMLAARRGDDGRLGWAFLGLAVVLGVVTALTLVGLAVTSVSASLSGLLAWLVPLSTVALVVLGVLLILGRNPFAPLTTVRMPVIRHPLAQAYVYGLLFGPVALPCAGPFIVALLAISIGVEETASRMLTFVAFGLGMGAPLILISLLGATRSRALTTWLTRHHLAIGRVAGALLVLAAFAEPIRGWLESATLEA
jgi:cytochrome c-type biogenesis protein